MMAGRLQTRFERIERVERKVDYKAGDSASLTQSRSVCSQLKGTGEAHNEGPSPQGCHQRRGDFDGEGLGLGHGALRFRGFILTLKHPFVAGSLPVWEWPGQFCQFATP